jgi:signal transduction histidine kinase
LVAVAETEPFDDIRGPRTRIYLLGFGSILLVAAAGLAGFGWIVARRIAATRAAAEAIIDGDLGRRLPLAGDGGVFDAQAATLNHMLDRITELMRGLTEVSNDIAHDLRTPLARLRGRLALLAGEAGDAATREGLEAAIRDSDALLALFAAILRITEVEGGARRAGFVALDLADLVEEIGLMMIPAAEDSGHALVVEARGPVPIIGDRQLLSQAIINLIENARRHTPAGSVIHLSAGRDSVARLRVRDNGPGITAADRPLALRRFGRLDASRGRSGHGLGLPLVEAIARLHRGTLALDDAEPGLRVTIALPLSG